MITGCTSWKREKNDLKLHNINNRDLFNLLGILLDRNGKLQETRDRAINYAREHRVEKTVIMTAAGRGKL